MRYDEKFTGIDLVGAVLVGVLGILVVVGMVGYALQLLWGLVVG